MDPERREELCALFTLSENAAALQRLAGGGGQQGAGQGGGGGDGGQQGGPGRRGGEGGEVRLVEHGRAHNISILLSGACGDGVRGGGFDEVQLLSADRNLPYCKDLPYRIRCRRDPFRYAVHMYHDGTYHSTTCNFADSLQP